MKIGVFDSGLGGLIIARAIRDALPEHDMLYLGDTLHVPYGSKSREAVEHYTRQAVDYLFQQDCHLIIMACNTASALVLRDIQQNYLPQHYPDRRVLGVVVPTLEVCVDNGFKRIGMLATERIVKSDVYTVEMEKIHPQARLFAEAAPLLVPAIELDGQQWLKPMLDHYLEPLLQKDIDCLILGCTHYSFLKPLLQGIVPRGIHLLSQDEVIPEKLIDYLVRHPEHDEKITRSGTTSFQVTDVTDTYIRKAQEIFKAPINFTQAHTG